jgi:hypothetical protein
VHAQAAGYDAAIADGLADRLADRVGDRLTDRVAGGVAGRACRSGKVDADDLERKVRRPALPVEL